MRLLSIALLILCVCQANADDENLPWTLGLDWSADGQYITVATSRGVHIRHSDDLSLYSVLGDDHIITAVWSNRGHKIAYSKSGEPRIVMHNLESGSERYLTFPSLYRPSSTVEMRDSIAQSIVWSPSDKYLAAGRWKQIAVWNVYTQEMRELITLWNVYVEAPQIDWRPQGGELLFDTMNGFAFWSPYTGLLVDFIWKYWTSDGANWPARWSPDGNMFAAGRGPVTVWKVIPNAQVDSDREIGGEQIHRLDIDSNDSYSLFGLSWHTDSTKLAFIKNGYDETGLNLSKSGALIWDLPSDTITVLPDVFNLRRSPVYKGIEWSPDGSKLAAMSSDGRIVIWETDTYDVIAEYAGYRSLLDDNADAG